MVGRELKKGVIHTGAKEETKNTVRNKGDLDLVTIIQVVSASGQVLTPAIFFPGKSPHLRRVNG